MYLDNGSFADTNFKISTYTVDGGNLIDDSAYDGKLSCNTSYNYINEEMIQLSNFSIAEVNRRAKGNFNFSF